MSAPVVTMTTASTVRVGPVRQTRKPYRTVRLTQMKWNGTVSQLGIRSIAARFAIENSTQATSSQPSVFAHCRSARAVDAIAHPPLSRDDAGAELRAEARDVDVYHVQSGIAV